MTRPRILRLLRVAVSAVCGLLCLALIVLWVRSCWHSDTVWMSVAGRATMVSSRSGGILVAVVPGVGNFDWNYGSRTLKNREPPVRGVPQFSVLGFQYKDEAFTLAKIVFVPSWFLVMLSAAVGAMPWLRWRFSLRTLLLATTLLAVMLGLVVAMR